MMLYDQLNIVADTVNEVMKQHVYGNDNMDATHNANTDNTTVANEETVPPKNPQYNPVIHQLFHDKQPSIGETEQWQKHTPKQIRASPDYSEWKLAEYQQLDMYKEQNMFGQPKPKPMGIHAWKTLWTYT